MRGCSTRRGYHFVPKFLFGQPSDVVYASFRWLPKPIHHAVSTWIQNLIVGPNAKYGLPEPGQSLFGSHPTVNSELLYSIRHGKIHPRPDVARFAGDTVEFTDGTKTDFDVIIACTGFKITFPFFDPTFLDWSNGQPVDLFLRVFHPDHPTLFFVGLIQPLGCIWPLSDLQARLVAANLRGEWTPPADVRRRIEAEIRDIKHTYTHSPRHSTEVHYHDYRAVLVRELKRTSMKVLG